MKTPRVYPGGFSFAKCLLFLGSSYAIILVYEGKKSAINC